MKQKFFNTIGNRNDLKTCDRSDGSFYAVHNRHFPTVKRTACSLLGKQILLLLFAVLLIGSAHAQRDPLKWPFSKTAIWNMPLHNSANYVHATIGAAGAYGMTTDEDHIVFYNSANPLKSVYEMSGSWGGREPNSNGNVLFSVRIPSGYTYYHATNNNCFTLFTDNENFIQTQPMQYMSSYGKWTSKYVWASQSVYGDGILGNHGGAGMSGFGGTVRIGELNPGSVIKHALKVNIYCALYAYYRTSEPDGKSGYRWPAVKCDSGAGDSGSGNYYGGSNPEVQMGTLLALKPDFNISSLRTEPAKILAKAMQDYGAYIVDNTAWDVYAIETEEGPQGSVANQVLSNYGISYSTSANKNNQNGANTQTWDWAKDMADIFTNLHAVTNNTSTTIGGGSTSDWTNRRAPMAPDFGTTVPVTGVTLSPTSASVAVNATTQLTATVAPSNATNKNVTWSTSNSTIATVSSSGLVTGKAAGSATITVTTQDQGKTATCAVTVTGTPPVGSGTITFQRWNNIAGTAVSNLTSNAAYPNSPSTISTLTSFEIPSNAADNYGVRVIGYVSPSTTGSYTFYIAGDDGVELWLSTNDQPSGAVKIASHTSWTNSREWNKFASQKSVAKSLTAGTKYFIYALMKEGSGGDNMAVGWTGPGISTISVIAGQFLYPYSIVPVTSVSVSPTSASVAVGATTTLAATVAPSNATNKNLSWSSSNTSIATVNSSGVVSGVAAGTATITVTTQDGNKTATCAVTVTSSSITYIEDFNDNNAQNWTILSGTWTATGNQYYNSTTGAIERAIYNGSTFADFTYMVKAKSVWNNWYGVIFNYQDANNYYYVSLKASTNIELRKVLNGTTSTLYTGTYSGGGQNVLSNIEISNNGTSTTVKVNGGTVFNNISTPQWAYGKIGLWTDWNPVYFDDVQVTAISTLKSAMVTTAIIDQKISQLHIYPNPASTSEIAIETDGDNGEKSLKIISISGKVVLEQELDNSNKHTVDISKISKGLYLVHLLVDDKAFSKKLLIE
jgi:uncharacterized protein YjdB